MQLTCVAPMGFLNFTPKLYKLPTLSQAVSPPEHLLLQQRLLLEASTSCPAEPYALSCRQADVEKAWKNLDPEHEVPPLSLTKTSPLSPWGNEKVR